MLTLRPKARRLMAGGWCKNPTTVTFIAHGILTTLYSHICWTPWSVFQDGTMKTISSTEARNMTKPTDQPSKGRMTQNQPELTKTKSQR
mmetsp:Transcript_7257/g.9409  ORF Transcript_7257/g.9409 Transcript_7257/m.9409 type:complete len:89 (+) Transcript_7257:2550-2816(+)